MPLEIKVLDAGLGTRLTKYVGDFDGEPLWTSKFLVANPDAIVRTHLDFLEAGANVIESFTYQATVGAYMKHLNVSEEQALKYIEEGGRLALKAKDLYLKDHPGADVEVFGSIGPYGVTLHDGSEYTGSYTDKISKNDIINLQRPRLEALIKAGIKQFAFETIPSKKEAEAVVELLKEYPDVKAWISFSCKNKDCISYGDNFKDTAIHIYGLNPKQIVAVGVNCLDPMYVDNLLKDVNKDRTGKDFVPLVVYPNKGDIFVPGVGYTEQKGVPPLHTMMKHWVELGARYIGGCCTTLVEDIPLWKAELEKCKNM